MKIKLLTCIFLILFLLFESCNNAEIAPDQNTTLATDSSGKSAGPPPAPPPVISPDDTNVDTIHTSRKPAPGETSSHHTIQSIRTIIDTSGIRKIIVHDSTAKSIIKVAEDTVPVINIAQLNKAGIVIWQLPENMKTLEESFVQVRIATNTNEQIAKSEMDTAKKSFGMAHIDVMEKMKVNLVAGKEGDFIIVAKDSIHSIPSKKYAEWFWIVTPLKSGTRYLILKVSQVSITNGKETLLEENAVFSKEFKVQISASFVFAQIWDFVKSNWAIITAIITFFAGLFVRKKIKDAQKTDT